LHDDRAARRHRGSGRSNRFVTDIDAVDADWFEASPLQMLDKILLVRLAPCPQRLQRRVPEDGALQRPKRYSLLQLREMPAFQVPG
jgi:hypothetical protein